MAVTLRGADAGHEQQIVDLEFLASTAAAPHPVFVLGSCDTDGVVFLWFLYIPKDALGNEIELRLLKKYSFYSLRRSTAAYYTRIRLAGTPDDGTMVLVRNDGSNCRIVNFSCHVDQPQHASDAPAIAASDPVPRLPPPEQPSTATKSTTSQSTPATSETPVVTSDPTPVTSETPPVSSETPVATPRKLDSGAAKALAAGAVGGAAVGATIGSLSHDSDERVIGEGLQGDEATDEIGETIGETVASTEPSTLVEDADEEDEYFDAVEQVTPRVQEHEHVHAEGLRETSEAVPGDTVGEMARKYSDVDEHEDVIAEEVIDEEAEFDEDDVVEEYDEHEEEVLEELEELEEGEYEEYVEPEVERVFGEGLGNGLEPSHAPRY